MRVWRILGDGVAVLAVLTASFGVVLTLIGLEARNWTWSTGMLTLTEATSGVTVFLLALSFRSRPRAVYLSIGLILLTFLADLVLDRNSADF